MLEQLYDALTAFRSEWLAGRGVDCKAPKLYQFGDSEREEFDEEQFNQWLNEMSGGE